MVHRIVALCHHILRAGGCTRHLQANHALEAIADDLIGRQSHYEAVGKGSRSRAREASLRHTFSAGESVARSC